VVGAKLVHPHLGLREALQQRARRPSVIEVDVRERHHSRGMALENRQQSAQAAAGPRIDDHVAHPPRADHLRHAQVVQVDQFELGL